MNREQQPIDQTPATDLVAQEHGPFHIDYDVTIDGEPTVNARELHKFLEVGKDFTNWIKGMIEKYGFSEGQDYVEIFARQNGRAKRGGHNKKEYFITFDMGKELSMVSKTPKGKEARKFFIESDKRRRELEAAPPALTGAPLLAAAFIEAKATLEAAQLQIEQKDAQLRTQAPLMESYRAHYSMEEVENFEAFADRWGFKNGPLTQVCEERGYLSKASKYRPNDISLEPGEEPTAELGIFRSKRVKTGTGDNQKQRVHATIICGKSPDLARLVLYRFGRDAFAKPKRKSDTRQTDKFNELCVELKAMRDDGYEFDNRLIAKMQIHPDIAYWAEHGTIDGVEDQGQVDAWASGWLCICPDYALFA
ncbi:MAG: antA/AntB antirepressor family protein [Pelagimonas sp.]|jgi:phage anti-repressor protein|nr:antA/AntB antirepressor family protein [Pelagimonas sp.]